MYKLLTLSIMMLGVNSFAGIGPLFNDIDEQVYLIVQGQDDDDAVQLYESLNVAETDDGTLLNKTVSYSHRELSGQPPVKVLEITCNKSKYVKDHISCSLIVNKSNISSIDYIRKSLLVGINDSYDARKLSKNFIFEVEHRRGLIFQSDDNSLNIFVTQNIHGEVISFTVTYN